MWRSREGQRAERALLARMLDEARRSGDYRSPWLLAPGIWRQFADEAEILRSLQRQWSIELSGALFAVIREGDGDLTIDVTVAHAETVARHHSMYRVLEANRDHPAIAASRRKERRLLESAGLRPSKAVA
jgi:hypothetical protein